MIKSLTFICKTFYFLLNYMTVAAADLAFHRSCGRLFKCKYFIRRLLLMTENKSKNKRRKRKAPYNSISYTTGDIGLNLDFFNKRMGTAGTLTDIATPCIDGSDSNSTTSMGETNSALCEAKRYVRRYYIRPQNRFASNKAEIIKILIELGNENCSIYTLNNLGDDKDVSKLMNSDIIYYYDDGILYDKNKVKVMDYDLSIKKEEERKHFSNVNKASDKEFKAEYEDRMTDTTELEEAFNLSFDDINVYGEKLTESKERYCSKCGEPIEGKGHITDDGVVCDGCELHFYIGG